MPSRAAHVLLQGGPRDGFVDVIVLPAPQLVAVAYCQVCGREHVHRVHGFNVPRPGCMPRYLLDYDATADDGGRVIYRYLDPDALDQELAQLLAERHAPA